MSAATLPAQRASIPDAALRLTEDAVLLDGVMGHVRAIRADDLERLRAFHAKLSSESISCRFFRYVPELSRDEARRFTHIDFDRQMALVATQGTGADEQIIAVVRYCGLSAEAAEVAFVVADAWQGHGIATLLFHRLADFAPAHGFFRRSDHGIERAHALSPCLSHRIPRLPSATGAWTRRPRLPVD